MARMLAMQIALEPLIDREGRPSLLSELSDDEIVAHLKGIAPQRLEKILIKANTHLSTAAWRRLYIERNALPVTDEDHEMIEHAMRRASEKCRNRRSHTYCVGKGRKAGAKFYGKPHLNCSRGREFSGCAEIGVIQHIEDEDDVLVKMVVVHFKRGLTHRSVTFPCAACIERLRRFAAPTATVIMRYNRRWIKFPIRKFFIFAYPTKHRNPHANI